MTPRVLPSLEPNMLGNGLPAGVLEYEAPCDICGELAPLRSQLFTFRPIGWRALGDSCNVCHAVCECQHDDAPLSEIGVWLRNGEPVVEELLEDVAA